MVILLEMKGSYTRPIIMSTWKIILHMLNSRLGIHPIMGVSP